NVKNSFELVNILKLIVVPSDHILISLDVTSLFTNIPQELVLNIIEEDWDMLSKVIKMKKENLIKLIKFCFGFSYFTFQDNLYQQVDSSSMGNPASPSLANVVMNFIINKALDKLDFHIPLLKLYVDDTLLLIPKDKVDHVFGCFNSINDKIKFNIEIEKESRLPFLDVMVIRCNGRLLTNWYVKETSSGRLLNFKSNHPTKQKEGMISGLLHRAINLSDESFTDENLMRVRGLLRNNNYLVGFVNKVIALFLRKRDVRIENVDINVKKSYKFPFIKGLSFKIDHCLKDANAKLVLYNLYTVNKIYTRLKDKTKLENKSNVVYGIPCSYDKIYVGQTSQYVRKRIAQHK
ncbi:GSCOCG00011645001-RA-CDS, partial [Cotesia congregata]